MVESLSINHSRSIISDRGEIFTLRWNFAGDSMAIGTSNGFVQIYDSAFEMQNLINCQSGAEKMPVSSIRFRPEHPESDRKPTMLLTTSDGGMIHWNINRHKSINHSRFREDQFYSADFNQTGTAYVLGCNDGKIKLFDENSFSLVSQFNTFEQGEGKGAQRVFCVKWFSDHLFLSAGWDDKITVWDERTPVFVREMVGPHVCGESVDVNMEGTVIAAAAYHVKDQITLWDLGTGMNLHTSDLNYDGKKCMAYCLQFKPESHFFITGGTGCDDFYVFDSRTFQRILTVNAKKAIFSMHISANHLALGLGNNMELFSF
jgi:WD40 repeat protein